MSMNLTHFIETLPSSLDQWNTSAKVDYYRANLAGFSSLSNSSQWFIAREFDYEDIQGTWDLLQTLPGFLAGASELSRNATAIFLDYLSNPEKIFALIPTEPTTTVDPDVENCLDPESSEKVVVQFMVGPAVLFMILLSFLAVRKMLCRSCCWGRPAIVYPINFIDEHSRRWAYASVFVLISYKALMLFENDLFWKPENDDWKKECSFCGIFLNMANVAGMCLVYYPLLACISMRKHILANILGFFYITPWIFFSIELQIRCPVWKEYDVRNTGERAKKFNAIFQVVFDVPVVIAYVVLIYQYCMDFCRNAYFLYLKNKKVDKYHERIERKALKQTMEVTYVKALFKRKAVTAPEGIVQKIKHFFKYERIEGFQYSPRMVCTLAVAGMVIFKLASGIAGLLDFYYTVLDEILDSTEPLFEPNNTDTLDLYRDYLSVVRWSLHSGNIFAFLFSVANMVHMAVTYRKHIRKYFRGHRSWHFKNQPSPASALVGGMRYSGYQVAFIVYGYFILMILVTVVALLFTFLCVFPWMSGKIGVIIGLLKSIWPTVLIGVAIYFAQILLAKFVFLQEFGAHLALNNRNIYHMATFFFFFFNIIVGLFSALKRIVFSMIFGTLLIARLDRCLLMRGVEQFDSAFKAYLGMLEVDCAHNHPVMKAFIQLLWQLHANKQIEELRTFTTINFVSSIKEMVENDCVKSEKSPTLRRHPKWRNKWWKAITLYNNPSLALDLMKQDMKKSRNSKAEFRRAVIDQATDVAAITVGAMPLSTAL